MTKLVKGRVTDFGPEVRILYLDTGRKESDTLHQEIMQEV